MKYTFIILSFLVTVLINGCHSGVPLASNGKKIKINLICDPNVESLERIDADRRRIVDGWMQDNLITLLEKENFSVTVLNDRSEFSYEPGNYLLEVRIETYICNFSKDLTTSFQFTGKEELTTGYHHISSMRSWRHCCLRLNHDMIKKIISVLPECNANKTK
jgi:hypothetical protein